MSTKFVLLTLWWNPHERPEEMVRQVNRFYDAIAVPDEFLVEVFQKSGVRIPIFRLPLGLDLESFLSHPLKQNRNPKMVFANLSSATDRKNHVMLIRAFAKALGNKSDALLLINSRYGDIETQNAIAKEIELSKCSNIQFTRVALKKDAYLKLFKSIDCYISLSKGEGFSIQPREAMALGIPVIATNNTGQSTICKSGLVKTVESKIEESANCPGYSFSAGLRYNCDLDEAAAAIQDVYENYETYLQTTADARKWASYYSYSNSHLKKLYKTLVAPKEILLGNENLIATEYLVTNSPGLCEKYRRLANHVIN